MYELYLERAAERDLRRLSVQDFQRVISRIKGLAKNPKPSGCHKITGSMSDWRLRTGDYGVSYEIDDKRKAIRVMRVRHRREAHR